VINKTQDEKNNGKNKCGFEKKFGKAIIELGF
jgi:hypothetical protein